MGSILGSRVLLLLFCGWRKSVESRSDKIVYQAFSAVSPIPLGIAGPTLVRYQLYNFWIWWTQIKCGFWQIYVLDYFWHEEAMTSTYVLSYSIDCTKYLTPAYMSPEFSVAVCVGHSYCWMRVDLVH
jgi:hypothetical protein